MNSTFLPLRNNLSLKRVKEDMITIERDLRTLTRRKLQLTKVTIENNTVILTLKHHLPEQEYQMLVSEMVNPFTTKGNSHDASEAGSHFAQT